MNHAQPGSFEHILLTPVRPLAVLTPEQKTALDAEQRIRTAVYREVRRRVERVGDPLEIGRDLLLRLIVGAQDRLHVEQAGAFVGWRYDPRIWKDGELAAVLRTLEPYEWAVFLFDVTHLGRLTMRPEDADDPVGGREALWELAELYDVDADAIAKAHAAAG